MGTAAICPSPSARTLPGFVENRVLYAIMRECLDLVEQGVIEPKDLDACVSWGIGYKLAVVGPMALLDMAGLDIYAAVGGYLNKELSNRSDVAAYITERTAQRKLGIKTGGGIYELHAGEDRRAAAPDARRGSWRCARRWRDDDAQHRGWARARPGIAVAVAAWHGASGARASAQAAEVKALALMLPEEPTDSAGTSRPSMPRRR